MTLRSIFIDPPAKQASALFRYGLLLFLIALLAGNIYNLLTYLPHYRGDPYGSPILAVMLLLNHVAFQFRFPPALTLTLRILAFAVLLFGLFYIFHLSRVLYPLR